MALTTRLAPWHGGNQWSPPVNLGPTINAPGTAVFLPSVSKDGLSLYFTASLRPDDDRRGSGRLPALPEYERKFQAKFGREMTAEEKRCYQLTRTGALPVKVKKKAADGSEVEETV